MNIIYISLPNIKKIVKYRFDHSSFVYCYQILDYLFKTNKEYFDLNWTYDSNIYKLYDLYSIDTYITDTSKTKKYKYNDPVLHTALVCLPNYYYHKNCNELISTDEKFLLPYEETIRNQEIQYQKLRKHMINHYGKELGYQYNFYGFNILDNYIIIREWCPQIKKLSILINYDTDKQKQYVFENESSFSSDSWVVRIPITELKSQNDLLDNNDHIQYRYLIETFTGEKLYKMSPYTKYYKQYDAFSATITYESFFSLNENNYQWKYDHINHKKNLKIYETHIGIAQQEKKVGTYLEFKNKILPYIKDVGYNCIQLMGILEHPHYSTFGYQPNFIYSPSSRFGTANELKELIDTAHGLGIKVILDIILGHSCSNELDGLKNFNGITNSFFTKTEHPLWKCQMFDFSNHHIFNYILSSLTYWVEEFKIDGFRFDAVTAIIYKDFGAHKSAIELSNDFFKDNVNLHGINFLRFANEMLHTKYPEFIVTIAEDVSGYPGICSEYYLGFDYRLGMHIPDIIQKCFPVDYNNKPIFTYDNFNIQMISEYFIKKDNSPMITYVESHDQAFVGSCTLFNAIAGKSAIIPKDLAAIEYNKRKFNVRMATQFSMMFRLLTYSVSGQGYMTFMGNEYGHPQWIEFPSLENKLSFDKCHRKWNLMKNKKLIFQFLLHYEKQLHQLADKYQWLDSNHYRLIYTDNIKQILVYKKLHQIFIFNFHTKKSYSNLYIPVFTSGNYRVVHSTQEKQYGGANLIKKGTVFKSIPVNNDLMRNTRLSRYDEKEYNEDYYLLIKIEELCGMIIELMIT